MRTSYLPTGQRSRLKEVIQMQISRDINPRRRRDSQFFLSCSTRSASSFIFMYSTFLVLFSLFKGCSLFVYSHFSFCRFTLSLSFRRLFGARQFTARVSLAHVVMSSITGKNFRITPYIYYACRIINYVCALLFLKTIATP